MKKHIVRKMVNHKILITTDESKTNGFQENTRMLHARLWRKLTHCKKNKYTTKKDEKLKQKNKYNSLLSIGGLYTLALYRALYTLNRHLHIATLNRHLHIE